MMNAPSFTYDNKIITVTYDMTLHITHYIPDHIDFQNFFYLDMDMDKDKDQYFLELMHIIFTKLISNVPDAITFKLYIYQIPSCMIPYKFVKDAFEILKPLIIHHQKTRYTYERYFTGKKEPNRSIFDLSYSDEEEYKKKEEEEEE